MNGSPTSDRPLAVATRQAENNRVIVTEWRFSPGAHTGWHRHAFDYVVVPLTTGTLEIETQTGVVESSLTAGQSYARDLGAEHDVINANDFEFVFIEIELK